MTKRNGALRALPTNYAGRRFRSRLEARWAIFFDACGIPFQYEPEGYDLPSGPYLPDFYLTTFGLFFEVKGEEPTERERALCLELAETAQRVVLLGVGQPEESARVQLFDPRGDEGREYAIAVDSDVDGCFWLVDVDDGLERWMGGGDLTGGMIRRGPVFTPLARAYAAANGARFEKGQANERVRKLVYPMRTAVSRRDFPADDETLGVKSARIAKTEVAA